MENCETMEPLGKRSKKSYVLWSKEEKIVLVETRIKMEKQFSGKNANAAQAWRNLYGAIKEMIGTNKTVESCKIQWKSTVRRYKSSFQYVSGGGTTEKSVRPEAADWFLFETMHEYARDKEIFHPPFLMSQPRASTSAEQNEEVLNLLRYKAKIFKALIKVYVEVVKIEHPSIDVSELEQFN